MQGITLGTGHTDGGGGGLVFRITIAHKTRHLELWLSE
jgi:hypothetical protein